MKLYFAFNSWKFSLSWHITHYQTRHLFPVFNKISSFTQIFAYNLEGRSNSSGEVKYSTRPAKPGYPKKPYVVGAIYAHQVKIGWGK